MMPLFPVALVWLLLVSASPASQPIATQRPEPARSSRSIGATHVTSISSRVAIAPTARGSSDTVLQHGYLTANIGYQGTSNPFNSAWSYPSSLETASVAANYSVNSGVLVEGGGGLRVVRDLTLGLTISHYHRSDPASVSGSIPHPFFFNQPRTLQATTSGLQRSETGIHVQGMWTFAVARKVQIGVFGGPTVFRVTQDLISALNLSDVYPYDTVGLASTSVRSASASKIGFNVGGDVTYLLHGQIGVGGMVRYSAATVTFTSPVDATVLPVKAGGLQAGAGLRVRF